VTPPRSIALLCRRIIKRIDQVYHSLVFYRSLVSGAHSLRADANQVAKRARPRLPGHPTAMSNENPKPDDESIDENRPI